MDMDSAKSCVVRYTKTSTFFQMLALKDGMNYVVSTRAISLGKVSIRANVAWQQD